MPVWRDSYNTRLLRAAARLLPPGAALERWDLLSEVPAYSEDDDREPAPEPVRALRDAIASARRCPCDARVQRVVSNPTW